MSIIAIVATLGNLVLCDTPEQALNIGYDLPSYHYYSTETSPYGGNICAYYPDTSKIELELFGTMAETPGGYVTLVQYRSGAINGWVNGAILTPNLVDTRNVEGLEKAFMPKVNS